MKKLIGICVLLAAGTDAKPQSTWTTDNAHTKVTFSVTHLLISQVEGRFNSFSGKVVTVKDDFSDAKAEFSMDVKSINTDNEMRDKHLKSDDFFNAEKYPQIKFTSASSKKISDKKYQLEGNLTIRDVTKPVTLDVTYNGAVKDPQGNTKAGFKVTGVVNRFDYNLKWNAVADAGPVVGKDVAITIDLELKKND